MNTGFNKRNSIRLIETVFSIWLRCKKNKNITQSNYNTMKNILLSLILVFGVSNINAQSCQEVMESVKSDNYGTTYTSYNSDAISNVTFYDVMVDYQYYYFAIVCFKQKNSYGCNEYIYQVSSRTKSNYSMSYSSSAGKAFWKYIEPHNSNLGCAPDFD